jgi:hypothetical protein
MLLPSTASRATDAAERLSDKRQMKVKGPSIILTTRDQASGEHA